jgi:hypothetical protein
MTGMGGTISAGASGITIRNSTFTSTIDVEGAIQHVVLDGDHFDWPAVSTTGGPNAKIFVSVSGASPGAALTVENSTILNGDLDGVHIGGGSGLLVQGNEFENLCDRNVNHTDNIQFEGGSQIRIAGNYVYEAQNCPTQGITSYDGGTNGVIIEDNVVDIPRDWGIELYADQNSIVRHNTVVYHPKTYSEFNTGTGQIDIDRKTQDPAGSGTEVYDNIATSVAFTNGSTGTAHNNVSGQSAIYVGPTTTYPGFQLASNSPVGLNAADDGTDDGVRVNTTTTTTTTPPPLPPPPTDTPAQAIWTAPSGATVGTPVTLDGTSSQGDAPLACSWSFENQDGSTVYETQTGCQIQKTFQVVGTKYVKLTVTDIDGDTSSNKQTFDVAAASAPPPADTTPPDTTIVSGPSGVTNDNTPTFTYSSTESGSSFQCRVDAGTWVGCTSPWTTSALADGAHTVAVRATDAAGNTDPTPATQSFTIDTVAPTSTITSAPAPTATGKSVTIGFTSNDPTAHFQCQLDGGSWAACVSPYTASGLKAGAHTFSVRAIDPAGNVQSPATSIGWTQASAQPPHKGGGASDNTSTAPAPSVNTVTTQSPTEETKPAKWRYQPHPAQVARVVVLDAGSAASKGARCSWTIGHKHRGGCRTKVRFRAPGKKRITLTIHYRNGTEVRRTSFIRVRR